MLKKHSMLGITFSVMLAASLVLGGLCCCFGGDTARAAMTADHACCAAADNGSDQAVTGTQATSSSDGCSCSHTSMADGRKLEPRPLSLPEQLQDNVCLWWEPHSVADPNPAGFELARSSSAVDNLSPPLFITNQTLRL